MRRLLNLAVIFVCAGLFLSACSGMKTHTEIEALKEAKAVGSPFTQRVTQEYRAIVKSRQFFMDYSDARHFAKKGLMAAEGKVVLPELLSNWHLDADSAQELRSARNRLMGLMDGGGRVQAPFEAAVAQGRFDCWIEQQEQNWLSPFPASCKAQFEKAYADLKSRMKGALPPSDKANQPIPDLNPKKPKPVVDPSAFRNTMDEGMFIVFFDFDRSTLTDSGLQVISSVAQQAMKRKDMKQITVIGHTDTSGSPAYNQRLSLRRAEAVKNALSKNGVSANQINIMGRGESSLMVATPNNTREPANRRTEIRFE
jgi:OOP family OmpA-OmpF porin